MLSSRHLLREGITNILHRLKYYDQQNEFFARIFKSCSWIQAIVAHHLGLKSPDECRVADMVS
jgi:hypothetical protein